MGVAVVDRDMMIQAWNRMSEELWGVRADEAVGTHFMNLDIGLPVQQLHSYVRDSLGGEAQTNVLLPARNRRGREIQIEITCLPLHTTDGVGAVILLMEESTGGASS